MSASSLLCSDVFSFGQTPQPELSQHNLLMRSGEKFAKTTDGRGSYDKRKMPREAQQTVNCCLRIRGKLFRVRIPDCHSFDALYYQKQFNQSRVPRLIVVPCGLLRGKPSHLGRML